MKMYPLSPEAHDSRLQKKVDELTLTPEEYHLKYEIERLGNHLEYNENMVRALNSEIDRIIVALEELNMKLNNAKGISNESK